jgi:hypothetical protein
MCAYYGHFQFHKSIWLLNWQFEDIILLSFIYEEELQDELMVDLAYLMTLHESPSTFEFSFQVMPSTCFDYVSYVTLQVRFVDEA